MTRLYFHFTLLSWRVILCVHWLLVIFACTSHRQLKCPVPSDSLLHSTLFLSHKQTNTKSYSSFWLFHIFLSNDTQVKTCLSFPAHYPLPQKQHHRILSVLSPKFLAPSLDLFSHCPSSFTLTIFSHIVVNFSLNVSVPLVLLFSESIFYTFIRSCIVSLLSIKSFDGFPSILH